PGLITIRTTRDKKNPKTENGFIGSLLLERPGATQPVARVSGKVTDSAMVLQHQATAAEAAVPGDWTCELANDALEPLIFATQVMGPVAGVPLQSASIDIGLLNLLLASATAAADVHLHVESGPPGTLSFISWSSSVTSLLKGLPAFYFH